MSTITANFLAVPAPVSSGVHDTPESRYLPIAQGDAGKPTEMAHLPVGDAPCQWRGQLTQARIGQHSSRHKRESSSQSTGIPVTAEYKSPVFPAPADARKADERLQENLTHWLITGQLKRRPIPVNASIKPFTDAFSEAVRAPQVQDWLKSKGLDLSTVRVFSDGVEGTVVTDGVAKTQRFTTTDGSGWWEVSAKLSEAVNALRGEHFYGVLLPDEKGEFRHVDVILDFYGLTPPGDPAEGPQLGRRLKQSGWPTIPDQKRMHWGKQFGQLLQKNSDLDARLDLASHLRALVKDKDERATLTLSDQRVVVHPDSTLAQQSQLPRERFVEWLATPEFTAFIDKIGFGGANNDYRISDDKLELRDAANQWISLQGFLDDEVGKVQVGGNPAERTAINALGDSFTQLLELSKTTGNAVYAVPAYDARQLLAFSGLGVPGTVVQVNSAIDWLTQKLPPRPMAGDYAELSPYTWAPGALSPGDSTLLKAKSVEPGSVTQLLSTYLATPALPSDPDQQLQLFFDSPLAGAKAQELAQSLNMVEVAGGRPLSRARRHQLLAAAIKAGFTDPLPGKPGVVAGYAIYQPGNLGRTLDEVRASIEAQLQPKGADTQSAPLIAHLLLAQAAPEFLVKSDPNVSVQAPAALKLSPGQVSIGSTAWMNLRLGCALAENLAGTGSSRSLNITQAQALTRLNPMGPEHELLIKSLGTQPLLDWAIMTGVFPETSDGRYSPGDYRAAAQAFGNRENSVRTAFQSMTSEPPTQTRVLIDQLATLFPEMTKEEIANFRLQLDTDTPFNPRQHAHLETRTPLLTEVILAQQVVLDPLFSFGEWLNKLFSGEKKYKFIHPSVSQETFNERIKNIPAIAPLVAPAVDQYLADTRSAQETMVKLMIANAPLDVRRALEVGKVELFTLREETGQSEQQDQLDSSKVAENTARRGVLMRYETGALTPRYRYFEMYPGSMKMVGRLLPPSLALGGRLEKGQVPYGPFAHSQTDFRKASAQPFDFEAFQSGSEPRPGVMSKVIIEKSGETLPGLNLSQWPNTTPVYVPNSWATKKTGDIAKAIVDATFDVKREPLMEYANEPTKLQKRRSYPFDSGKVFTLENMRTVLSLIPFVGAIMDIGDGNVGAGLKGLAIDFGAFVITGGLSGARKFFSGLKALIPFSGRAFTMTEAKGAVPFFRSLFNPLDGLSDVLKVGPKAVGATKQVLSGDLVPLGAGFYLSTTAFEKCRWGVGVYETLGTQAVGQVRDRHPGSTVGMSQNCALYAVQIDAKWYAIDPVTQQPAGTPLEDFTPDALVG